MHIIDFTEKIKLGPRMQKRYNIARLILLIFFSTFMLSVMYRILFPTVPLDFNMATPNSNKNTIASPRTSQTGEFPEKGFVNHEDKLTFNANPVGKFSDANISIYLSKNQTSIADLAIKIRKSYRAFLYPNGDQVGFKDATLLSIPSDVGYYIVSDGKIRKFKNTDIILTLGYPKSAFIEISSDDLASNKIGEEITDSSKYPNDTLFLIDNNYYQMKNQELSQFISVRAFLSQFDPKMAISKNSDFLSQYPISNTYSGFINGTLASSVDSVFILSEGKSYPIENEVTFASMGFDWNDVTPLTNDELSIYKKQKQFTHNDPHPDGIVFLDRSSGISYLIGNKTKHPITNQAVLETYKKQRTILADSNESNEEISCALKKKLLSANTYTCNAPLEKLNSLLGNDFELSITFPISTTISTINTIFSTPMTFDSLMSSLSVIKTKLKNR